MSNPIFSRARYTKKVGKHWSSNIPFLTVPSIVTSKDQMRLLVLRRPQNDVRDPTESFSPPTSQIRASYVPFSTSEDQKRASFVPFHALTSLYTTLIINNTFPVDGNTDWISGYRPGQPR